MHQRSFAQRTRYRDASLQDYTIPPHSISHMTLRHTTETHLHRTTPSLTHYITPEILSAVTPHDHFIRVTARNSDTPHRSLHRNLTRAVHPTLHAPVHPRTHKANSDDQSNQSLPQITSGSSATANSKRSSRIKALIHQGCCAATSARTTTHYLKEFTFQGQRS